MAESAVELEADDGTSDTAAEPSTMLFVGLAYYSWAGGTLLRRSVYEVDASSQVVVLSTNDRPHLAADFSAREAIETWSSPAWSDLTGRAISADASASSPSGGPLPVDVLDLIDQSDCEELSFAIRAFLNLDPSQRLYLAASPERVAGLIAGLTRALPRAMVRDLSFTTYGPDPQSESPKVVGTWWPSSCAGDRDLPEQCYGAWGLGLNTHTGRRSELAGDPLADAYASFAATSLVNHRSEDLAWVLERADSGGVADVERLLTLFASLAAERLGMPLMASAIRKVFDLRLAPAVLDLAVVQDAIIMLAASDPAWWTTFGQRFLNELVVAGGAGSPEFIPALIKLADTAISRAADALSCGDWQMAERLLEGVTRVAAPDRYSQSCARLLEIVRVPESISREARAWVLRYACVPDPAIASAVIEPWLKVSLEESVHVLDLDVPPEWKGIALRHALATAPPSGLSSDTLARLVLLHRLIVAKACTELQKREDGADVVLRVMHLLLHQPALRQEARELTEQLLSAQSGTASLPANLLMLLDRAFEDDELLSLFERYLDKFLISVSQAVWFDDLCRWYLDSMTVWRCPEPDVRTVMARLANHDEIMPALRRQATAWATVGEALVNPELALANVEQLADACAALGRSRRPHLLGVIGGALGSQVESADAIGRVVESLGPKIARDDWALFATLFSGAVRSNIGGNRLAAYVNYAWQQEAPADVLEQIESVLVQCDRTVVREVHRGSRDWPDPARSWWGGLLDRRGLRTSLGEAR